MSDDRLRPRDVERILKINADIIGNVTVVRSFLVHAATIRRAEANLHELRRNAPNLFKR